MALCEVRASSFQLSFDFASVDLMMQNLYVLTIRSFYLSDF